MWLEPASTGLLKLGPLAGTEREEMKKHPRLGWELLQKIEILKPASRLVLEHQEMWNGRGYPQACRANRLASVPGCSAPWTRWAP